MCSKYTFGVSQKVSVKRCDRIAMKERRFHPRT